MPDGISPLPGSARGGGARIIDDRKRPSRFEEFLMQEPDTGLHHKGAKRISASDKKNPFEIGSEALLRILIAQLTHQNPLNPTDGTEFVNQMAMFSNIQQATEMNVKLEKLLEHSALSEKITAAQFVGKTIEAPGQWFETGGDELFELSFDAPENLTDAVIRIFDKEGTLVKEIPAATQPTFGEDHKFVEAEPCIPPPGRNKAIFVWNADGTPHAPGVFDGHDNNGNYVAPGVYRFAVIGKMQQRGKEVEQPLPTHIRSKVTEVVRENGKIMALLGQIPVLSTKIESFSEAIPSQQQKRTGEGERTTTDQGTGEDVLQMGTMP
ncbi:MAG: hypothetical protein LBD15_03720 [Holosporales bacterium]|jgi:flagellar hook assembly protein FlgD|nr:hypothetical protein [Holosporales bacterium]